MSRVTLATFKKLAKNENLYIKCKSDFDPMSDGVKFDPSANFKPVERGAANDTNTLGIKGVWLVLGSRDYFQPYAKDGFNGIEVWNCCGSFVLANRGLL